MVSGLLKNPEAGAPPAFVPRTPESRAGRADTKLDLDLRHGSWQAGYARRLFFTDLAVLITATVFAAFLRFGNDTNVTSVLGLAGLTYPALGIAIATMWWIALAIFRTRDLRIVGHGPDEYARVARTTILVFGWLAILSLILKWDMSRGYLAFAFPLGLLGLLLGRKFWRVLGLRVNANAAARIHACWSSEVFARRSESLRTFTPLATADTASLGSGCQIDRAISMNGSTSLRVSSQSSAPSAR